MTGWYKLVGHETAPCSAFEAMQERTKNSSGWIVAKTQVGPMEVSTVFLGLDHSYGGGGPPLLFETMIFCSQEFGDGEYQKRCSTWDEAVVMHAKAVLRAEAVLERVGSISWRA